ncbi:hypothetical protein [Nostoc sp.]
MVYLLSNDLPRKAEGRGQKEENIIFALSNQGFKAPKFIYEKKKKYVFRDAQRKKYCVPIESPKFIYGVSLLPSASCLLQNAIALVCNVNALKRIFVKRL